MKKKTLLFTAAVLLLTLLFVIGCPNDDPPAKPNIPPADAMITAISIAGVNITPLPQPAANIAGAVAGTVVVNTERSPTESEDPGRIYYKPAQPVSVTLVNLNQTVYFEVTRPDEEPLDIVLPHSTKEGSKVTRTIGIILPNDDNFQIGQVVWIKVVAADESKEYIYKINVVNQTHDTAVASMKVGGDDVLDPTQTRHIGPWISSESWADAVEGLANLKTADASSASVAVTTRNNKFDLAKPHVDYAKISAGTPDTTEPVWGSSAPNSFANNDILAVKVTASNGTSTGYLKIKISVGGSPFLSGLTVNGITVNLGAPGSDMSTLGGAYRVEDGQTLTASPVTWAVVPAKEDTNATVTWALVAKGVIPQAGDFTNPTFFSNTANYLYIKVVSANSDFTMYYLVVYDERPRDTEHVKTGSKAVPTYRFTIPDGKTWADLGTYPRLRAKILLGEDFYDLSDGYQRNFIFGELSRMSPPLALDTTNLSINPGGSGFNVYMTFLLNRRVRDFAIDTPAADMWFTAEYPLNDDPDWKAPWGPSTKPDIRSSYNENYWPTADTTGDVYFGYGITHDQQWEYWIKELSLVSQDGKFEIFCDLLGNGRIDSDSRNVGFVTTSNDDGIEYLREMVADPTLK
jgi:hypothetical protein